MSIRTWFANRGVGWERERKFGRVYCNLFTPWFWLHLSYHA